MTVGIALRRALDARDGHRCAWHILCNEDSLVPHHRSNRGMGGDPSKDRLSNLVWLCSMTNGLLESDPVTAERGRQLGIKLSIHANPAREPIVHSVHGLCLLDDIGGAVPIVKN